MFAKCPHCGASILDDSEEICPSCDQPLKGPAQPKPAAKPEASAKPAAKPKADGDGKAKAADGAAAPAAKRPTRKVVTAKDVADDDDPFDIRGNAGKKALRVQPKPSKGRMHRVECPMCEAPGFVPKSAAGTEVRCWKKDCTLPLFNVPAIEKPPEPEPEPKKKPIGAIVVLLLFLAGGGGAAFYFMQPPTPERVIEPVAPVVTDEGDANNTDTEPSNPLLRDSGDPDKVAVETTLSDVAKAGLGRLQREIDSPRNGARDDSIRIAAEALIQSGQADQAKQLLARIPSRIEFFKIRPLNAMAMQALETGDRAAAETLADEGLQLAKKLPPAGREALDWATDLAILLIKLDRVDEAASLMRKYSDAGIRGEYSALMIGARYSGKYDLSDVAGATLIRDTPNPQWVAVTRALIADGLRDVALDWARRGAGSIGEDSLVAWAGTLRADERVTPASVAEVASSPTLAARLLAAAGLEEFSQATSSQPAETSEESDATPVPPEVTALLNAAKEKLPTEAQQQMPVPSTVALYRSADKTRSGLEDPAIVRAEALAFEKVAELLFVTGDAAAGWSILQQGLESLRAYAPSPVAMRRLVEQYDSNRNSLRSQLGNELNISGRSALNSAFSRYRRQVDRIAAASEKRFELQERLARVAIAAGADKELVDWMTASGDQEPWWSSATAAVLVQSDDAAVAATAKANAERNLPEEAREWGRTVRDGILEGNASEVANKLRTLKDDPYRRGLFANMAGSLLVKQQDFDGLRDFLKFMSPHPATRRDVVEMVAAQAAVSGSGVPLYENLSSPSAQLSPEELTILFSGIAIGAAETSARASDAPSNGDTTGAAADSPDESD